jgi:hypothetical protein
MVVIMLGAVASGVAFMAIKSTALMVGVVVLTVVTISVVVYVSIVMLPFCQAATN